MSPGGSVSVSWSAEGESALLCLRFAGGYTGNRYEVAASGSQTLAIEEDFWEDIILDLHVTNSAGHETKSSIYIPPTCPADSWFFDDPPESCPNPRPGWKRRSRRRMSHGHASPASCSA